MAQNFGSPIVDKTKDAREALRAALGLGTDVPFADYVNHIPSQWTPAEIFRDGQKGFWYEPSDIATLSQDAAGLVPVTSNKDPIGRMKDKSGNNVDAVQSVSARRMMYKVSPPRFLSDNVDDEFIVDVPAGGWTGEMIIATDVGTATYKTSLPAGQYLLNSKLLPRSGIIGALFRENEFTDNEKSAITKYFVSKGAVESYINTPNFSSMWDRSSLTNFPYIDTSGAENISSAWERCQQLTSFPKFDFSNVKQALRAWSDCIEMTEFLSTDFSKLEVFTYAWYRCKKLTDFPLIDTSSAIYLYQTWQDCSGLTSFPPINTSKVYGFSNAWGGCKGLVSFPFIDTSSGYAFGGAWRNCSNLENIPLSMFDNIKGGDFLGAFASTNLSQVSIDGILTSLVTSGVATGTRRFDQSGGSAPSEVGKAAIDTLRSRGWTVSVTGGY